MWQTNKRYVRWWLCSILLFSHEFIFKAFHWLCFIRFSYFSFLISFRMLIFVQFRVYVMALPSYHHSFWWPAHVLGANSICWFHFLLHSHITQNLKCLLCVCGFFFVFFGWFCCFIALFMLPTASFHRIFVYMFP